jgi:ribosomal 50S subunit-recycling heat shock protein
MAKKVIRSDIRVNKYISDSGFCSRREADKMIADERVTINGELATLGSRVAEGDKVKIDGEPLHFIPMEQREYKLRRYGSSRKEKLSGAENPEVEKKQRGGRERFASGQEELRPNRRSKNSMVKKSHQGRKSKTYAPKKVVKEGEEKSKNRTRTKLVPGKASSGNVKKKIK